MERIVALEIVFQSRVSKKARDSKVGKIVRRENIDGPYRDRIHRIEADIALGAGSGANLAVRRIIYQEIKKRFSGEILFYVRAEIEAKEGRKRPTSYFKTIVPRSQIPF